MDISLILNIIIAEIVVRALCWIWEEYTFVKAKEVEVQSLFIKNGKPITDEKEIEKLISQLEKVKKEKGEKDE